MVNSYDVETGELIKLLAKELKNFPEIKAPEWSKYAKTGVHKERVPENPEWWHTRAASVLRKVSILGPIGVSKLTKKYGGKRHRGSRPDHFHKGSGSVARKILQQLQAAKLIQNVDKGPNKGRKITPQGMSLIDKAAIRIMKSRPKPAKEAQPKKETAPEAKAQ